MKTNRYLLPNSFKRIGWVLSIPSAIVLLVYLFSGKFGGGNEFFADIFDEPYMRVADFMTADTPLAIFMVLLMFGLLFIAFSREKIEDEYITKLRGDSLIWAVIANAILIVILSVTVFGGGFLFVTFFNLYTTFLFFIIKFQIVLHRFSRENSHEE